MGKNFVNNLKISGKGVVWWCTEDALSHVAQCYSQGSAKGPGFKIFFGSKKPESKISGPSPGYSYRNQGVSQIFPLF